MAMNQIGFLPESSHYVGLCRTLRLRPTGLNRNLILMAKRFSFIFMLISAVLCFSVSPSFGQEDVVPETLSAALGEPFILRQNQSALIIEEGLEVKIVQFYNSPCPDGANCVWSGVGIAFEYYQGEEVRKGLDLVQAFGYQTTIIKTDHETYAQIKLEKL